MRLGWIAAAAAAMVVSAPVAAQTTISFGGPNGTYASNYEESGVAVSSTDANFPIYFVYGLHADEAGPGPSGYRIALTTGRAFHVLGVTQTCCIFDDGANGSATGGLAYYDAAGNLLDRLLFTPLASPNDRRRFDLNWTGGSYLLFSGDHVSVADLTVAGVPEPGTWAFMIVGFGAVGASIRRRATVHGRACLPA